MTITLSSGEARRVALAAQSFGIRRPERPTVAHVRRTLDRLGLFQIDSVNVLTRAHYLPAFSTPAAALIRPDGHVAWVGDGGSEGLADALERWFGGGC